MANTKIEWAEKSWNPVTGCTPVSEGCKNCWAKRVANRLQKMGNPKYKDGFKVKFHPYCLDEPLHWKKPRRIFVSSMGDLFHENVSALAIRLIFDTIEKCPQHKFLILTKRPDNAYGILCHNTMLMKQTSDYGFTPNILNNIWHGVSVENNRNAWRIEELMKIPAAVRFVSLEPMLERVYILPYLYTSKHIDWVICGGESGPGKRPFNLDWARDLRDQCREAGVPFFFKQVDKVRSIPEDLMIREYPE